MKAFVMKHRTWFVLLAMSVVYTLVFCRDISPLFISKGGDSLIFRNMGLAMLQGKTPYIDIFDHKGILLYYINALGMAIGPNFGVCLLAIISTTITLRLWYNISNLFVQGKLCYIPVILGILALIAYSDDGNKTEEWSLPLMSFILFQTVRGLKNDIAPTITQGLFAGAFACAIFFLRANNAYLIATCCIISACYLFLYKKYASLFLYSAAFILGFALSGIIILGPIYLLYGEDGIQGTFYGTFLFNLMYAAKHAVAPNLIIVSLNATVVMASAFALYLSRKQSSPFEKALIALGYILFFITRGGAGYPAYHICLIPLFTYLIALSLNQINKQSIIFMAIPFLYPVGRHFAISAKRVADRISNASTVRPISQIPNNELDSIWRYNATATITAVIHNLGHTQCNRLYHPFQGDIDSTLKESIQESKPLWIALAPKGEWYAAEDSTYIKEHYELRDSAVTHYKEKILFYRRKN